MHATRKRTTASDPLVAGVLDLKKALDQTVAQFAARVTEDLGEVLRSLEAEEPTAKGVVREMIGRIREVKLKPEKGRLKDLVRIHDLAEDLAGMVPGR